MRRIANATGINPKMYRHFAIATVGVTGLLGIFADGESREVLATQVVAQAEKASDTRAKMQKTGQATFTKPLSKPDSVGSAGFDYSDAGGTFGGPMDSAAGEGANAGVMPSDLQGGRNVPADYEQYGLTRDQWEALSEEERRRIRGQGQPAKSAAQKKSEADALLAASRRRSSS